MSASEILGPGAKPPCDMVTSRWLIYFAQLKLSTTLIDTELGEPAKPSLPPSRFPLERVARKRALVGRKPLLAAPLHSRLAPDTGA
jgi:hypothetical protein